MQIQRDGPAGRRRGALVATVVASGVAFVALALVVGGGALGIDLTVAEWLGPLRLGLTGSVMDAVNLLGQAPVWDALVVLLAVALWLRGLRFEAVVLVVGVIGAEAGASATKIIVGRTRPPGIEVADLITQASFPSGHVTRAVVTIGLLAATTWNRRRWRVPVAIAAVAFIVLMGIARLAVGEHWFTDVVGAGLYGVLALGVIGVIAESARPAFARRLRRPLESGPRS